MKGLRTALSFINFFADQAQDTSTCTVFTMRCPLSSADLTPVASAQYLSPSGLYTGFTPPCRCGTSLEAKARSSSLSVRAIGELCTDFRKSERRRNEERPDTPALVCLAEPKTLGNSLRSMGQQAGILTTYTAVATSPTYHTRYSVESGWAKL